MGLRELMSVWGVAYSGTVSALATSRTYPASRPAVISTISMTLFAPWLIVFFFNRSSDSVVTNKYTVSLNWVAYFSIE